MTNRERDLMVVILNQADSLLRDVRNSLERQSFIADSAQQNVFNDLVVTANAIVADDPILSNIDLMPDSVVRTYLGGFRSVTSMPPDVPSRRLEAHLVRLINRLRVLTGVFELSGPASTSINGRDSVEDTNPPRVGVDSPKDFYVALSFAGSERKLAESLAEVVRNAGFKVFYDGFVPGELWGRDLPVFFDEIYRLRSRYAVIFVSSEYTKRMWTNHERKSALARAMVERGDEYILPIVVDAFELPGFPPTIGYLSLKDYSIQHIAAMLTEKLKTRENATSSA